MTPEQAFQWALAHPDLVLSLVGLLVGSGHSLRVYRRTGRLPLADLPWKAIRRTWYAFRAEYATYPKPDRADLWRVNCDIATLRKRLGRQSYELEWPFSLQYRGEDVNARRYVYDGSREHPHRQVHIRAWDEGEVCTINAHEEPSALHHPRIHIRSTDMQDVSQWVAMRWDNPNGLDPRGLLAESRQRQTAES